MTDQKQVTVIGATGNIGAPVVRNLAGKGYQLKLVVRDKLKAEKFFHRLPRIEIQEADLTDMPSLRKALQGTKYLYLNLSTNTTDPKLPFLAEREGVANILKSIDQRSIQQILLISGLGAFEKARQSDSFEFIPNTIRKQGHKLIKESGIPYTILHCSSFLDNFVLYQRKGTYPIIGNPDFLVYFTNCYDYSELLVNAIGNEKAYHREFPVQGRDGVSQLEASKRFLSSYDPSVKVKPMPRGMISFLSLFIKEMKFVKHMADYFSHKPEEFIAEDHETFDILGEPSMSIDSYAGYLKSRH
jgi:uncharacterized protein YbjT (DUF2867 family)